jgi:hypothetical protein
VPILQGLKAIFFASPELAPEMPALSLSRGSNLSIGAFALTIPTANSE